MIGGGRQLRDPNAFPLRKNIYERGQEINCLSLPSLGMHLLIPTLPYFGTKKSLGQAGLAKLLNLFRLWECGRAPQKRPDPGTLYPPAPPSHQPCLQGSCKWAKMSYGRTAAKREECKQGRLHNQKRGKQ